MIVALLLLACLGSQTPVTPSAQQDLATVEREALDLVQRQPSAINWQKLALTFYLRNRHADAIEAFGKALRSDPSLWTSHLFLGISLYRTNQFASALASLERADRLAPKNSQGRDDIDYWLGASHIALRHPLQGLQYLERLLARNPRHSEALQLATETYAETASGLWNNVAERAFNTAAGQEVHGYALESEGNRPGAIEAFTRSLALSPNRSGPAAALGRLLLTSGELSAAREALARELRIDPSAPTANFYAGLLALRENRPADALKPLQLAAAWMPANEEPALALCQAYLTLGDPSNAVGAAKQAVAAEGNSLTAHELLIASLSAAGDQSGVEQENSRWQRESRKR
jgi:tetratricopeptide (TPR) repeat protein